MNNHQRELNNHQLELGSHTGQIGDHQRELERHTGQIGDHQRELERQIETVDCLNLLEGLKNQLNTLQDETSKHREELDANHGKMKSYDEELGRLSGQMVEWGKHREELGLMQFDKPKSLTVKHRKEPEANYAEIEYHDEELVRSPDQIEDCKSDTKELFPVKNLKSLQI